MRNHRASLSSDSLTPDFPGCMVRREPSISWLGNGHDWLPKYETSFTLIPNFFQDLAPLTGLLRSSRRFHENRQ